MANYLKPQFPLKHKDGDYFYPLTTADQVIMEDGTRLSAQKQQQQGLNIDLSGAIRYGEVNYVLSADKLSGHTIDEFVLKSNGTITINLNTDNGRIVSNVNIKIYNNDNDELIESCNYTAPITLLLPIGTYFRVECGEFQGYRTPEVQNFVVNSSINQNISILYEQGKRYGFRREKAESNPDYRITYLYDAVGMTPAKTDLTTNIFSPGSWGEFIEEVARPVMLKYDGTVDYELNHDNQTYKIDGTLSDIKTGTYDGNAMVEFRKYKWVKRYQDLAYEYVIFSDIQYDNTYHAYAHTNENGIVQDAFYYGMYEGSNDGTRLRSLCSGAPLVSQARTFEINKAIMNGAGYYTISKSTWEYIGDLLTLISKNDNSQAMFGVGAMSGSLRACGGTVNYPAFWGTSAANYVKVFWIENFWGNVWEGMGGYINNGSRSLVKMVPPYNTTGAGYLDTGINSTGKSVNFVKDTFMSDETGWIPYGASGASETTYMCDNLNFNTSKVNYAFVGGSFGHGTKCGSRCIYLNYTVGDVSSDIGSRILYIKP